MYNTTNSISNTSFGFDSKYVVFGLINSCSEYLTNYLSFVNLKKKNQFILQKCFFIIKNNFLSQHSRIIFFLVRILIIINGTFENLIITKLKNNNLILYLMESTFINKVFSVSIFCIL